MWRRIFRTARAKFGWVLALFAGIKFVLDTYGRWDAAKKIASYHPVVAAFLAEPWVTPTLLIVGIGIIVWAALDRGGTVGFDNVRFLPEHYRRRRIPHEYMVGAAIVAFLVVFSFFMHRRVVTRTVVQVVPSENIHVGDTVAVQVHKAGDAEAISQQMPPKELSPADRPQSRPSIASAVKHPRLKSDVSATAPASQKCEVGANCAMSFGQQGGITAGVYNGPPPLELRPSLRVISSDTGRLSYPPGECPVKTQLRVVPNQAVPPPIEIALDFDKPVSKIGAVVEGAAVLQGGGPFRLGTHALTTVVSPGINPTHPLIVEVCSAEVVRLTAPPHLE